MDKRRIRQAGILAAVAALYFGAVELMAGLGVLALVLLVSLTILLMLATAALVLAAVRADTARTIRQLRAWATTDPLTGLANRRAFHARLAAEMARFRRYGNPVAVAMLDIDHFKQVNDTAGHLIGDSVLATVARRTASVMRADALVARVGGDELAVIVPECDAGTAEKVVERAREAVSQRPIAELQSLTISAGICDSTHASTPDEILRLADLALYRAKDNGRDSCVRYSPGELVA